MNPFYKVALETRRADALALYRQWSIHMYKPGPEWEKIKADLEAAQTLEEIDEIIGRRPK